MVKTKKKKRKPFIEVDPEAVDLLKSGAKVLLWILGSAAVLTVAVALPGLAQVVGGELGRRDRAEM